MKLWVDDLRPKPDDYDKWAKTTDEAITFLSNGDITHVSFDHDLGDLIEDKEEKTGYDIALWVEENAFFKRIPPFTYTIHSANPVGARNIKQAMSNAERYWENNEST